MGASAFWLVALIALIVGEAATAGLVCIWFAAGALGSLLVAVFGGAIWLQIAVFLVLSALALALVRPIAARLLQPGKVATNADRILGKTAVVIQAIDNIQGTGQVKVAGQVWSARSGYDVVIPVGTEVVIQRIEGVKVFVETA
ncbi:MAG: NfeD family protein [Ruminococcaceae bacterium]|nr:NfeD family protein [Oscillospiraceae bacterium]